MRRLEFATDKEDTVDYLKDLYIYLRMPSVYLAESVDDFSRNRLRLKHSFFQKVLPNPICPDYAHVILHNVRLDPWRDKQGDILEAMNQMKESALVFDVRDYSGRCQIFWPRRPHTWLGYSDAQISQGLRDGDLVYRLHLFHDLNYQNSFVLNVTKQNPDEGAPRGKRIKLELKDILPGRVSDPGAVLSLAAR
ncbi:hypothetical protein JW711_01420 [Candidatus Woesearchaeota archaeon]|nr:hypothetical protein [Candidatus Woesearchaeota archaeon]